jgi:protein-S-isoprenylcysteine O-methyltransferase Ste14
VHTWLLWITAAIWIAFLMYWSGIAAAAQASSGNANAAPDGADITSQPKRRPWISIQIRRPEKPAATDDSTKRESAASRQVHQLLFQLALLLALVPWFWPLCYQLIPATLLTGLGGLGLQLACAALYLWGKRCLGRHWSGAVKISADQTLVRSGPYRLLRHPLYSGLLGMFLGTTIISGQVHALLGLLIITIAYGRKIRIEERHLLAHFGDAYRQYQRESWALIPGLF